MNFYSDTWFELFMDTIAPAQTMREVAFLARQLPLPACKRVLDLCCGNGRHATLLVERGYDVTGIDVSERALAHARRAIGDRARLIAHDIRRVDELSAEFDAILLLWQSFGQFDNATNLGVLRQVSDKLVPNGRFVLDLYHRGFFETRLATQVHEKLGRTITETKHIDAGRLTVHLDYGNGIIDRFDWRVYTPEEIVSLARSIGLDAIVQCTEFDESRLASTERPRMQCVFVKR